MAVVGLLAIVPNLGSCTSRYELDPICRPPINYNLREEEKQKKKENRVYIDLEKFTQD